ncbi:16S rRNA (uracil(1498)-N(3))-methyltransferase [Candidatus Dependentiae bacterium]|nr:16S rRNA (uracil(1498)-N(3))-methyltransferase [Candidatus Dependentiae bacterium]
MALSDKHIFAIYIANFWNNVYKVDAIVKIIDPDIVHRLIKVLRIQIGQRFIFFDSVYHGIIEISDISKKYFLVTIINFEKNIEPLVKIKFLLPLLKKEALEEAVYSLVEIGVSEIQLVVTQKSRQKLLNDNEFVRLEAIVVSAAEQSKNYVIPKIKLPIHLSDIQFSLQEQKIVFDPQGESFFDLKVKILKSKEIHLLVGPEGGLAKEELQQLEHYLFQKCRLTSTILRAVQAISVGVGLFKAT